MMKKIYTSILSFALLGSASFAQTSSHNHGDVTPCGTTEAQEQLFQMHPEYKAAYDAEQSQFQADYETFMQSYNPNAEDRVTYIVPVVVHIVHLGGPENVTDQQVYDAIDNVNEDFNMANSDLSFVIPDFQGIIGDVDFEFRLAKLDPAGNCTNGITRTYSSTTDDTGLNNFGVHPIVSAVQAEHGTWAQNKYLNIFVCRSVNNGAAAYTYNPASWYPQAGMLGGIVCLYNYFGDTGAGSSRHTLSHEVGHWFNLSHVWGPNNDQGQTTSCSTDDQVTDTPNTIGTNGTCDLAQNTCGSLDNIQNIMDYSNCTRMFTQGQAARMITSITSSTAGRNNLWTAQNLADTGVDTPGDACMVRVEETSRVICAGNSITFSDISYNNIVSRNWTFAGGDITSSTDSTVTVTYTTPGQYDVSLEVVGAAITLSETYTDYITVIPSTGDPINYVQNFEGISAMPDYSNFFVENPGDNNTWELATNISSVSGTKSIKLSNYGQLAGNRDAFVSTTIDLSSLSSGENCSMSFDYAYNKKNSFDDEQIIIFGSNDCGETWFTLKTYSSDDLNTTVNSSAYNTPGENDWQTKDFTVYPLFFVDNFRFKIEFVSDGGNNIFIDNINIFPTDQLGTKELAITDKMTVYPNPTTNISNISFFSSTDTEATIELYNVVGAKIQTVYNGAIAQGENLFTVDMNNLPKGVYFVTIKGTNGTQTVKLIKE